MTATTQQPFFKMSFSLGSINKTYITAKMSLEKGCMRGHFMHIHDWAAHNDLGASLRISTVYNIY